MPKRPSKLCKVLAEMRVDEKNAYTKDYPKLLRVAKGFLSDGEYRIVWEEVTGIMKDEGKHHGLMDGLYRYHCGRQR